MDMLIALTYLLAYLLTGHGPGHTNLEMWQSDCLHHLHAENHAEKILKDPCVAETTKAEVN